MKKDDLPSVPSLTCSYVKNFLNNSPMAGEISLTKEELKDLYNINLKTVFFIAIDKTEFLTESEPESCQTDTPSQTELEHPEAMVSLFGSTGINISVV